MKMQNVDRSWAEQRLVWAVYHASLSPEHSRRADVQTAVNSSRYGHCSGLGSGCCPNLALEAAPAGAQFLPLILVNELKNWSPSPGLGSRSPIFAPNLGELWLISSKIGFRGQAAAKQTCFWQSVHMARTCRMSGMTRETWAPKSKTCIKASIEGPSKVSREPQLFAPIDYISLNVQA